MVLTVAACACKPTMKPFRVAVLVAWHVCLYLLFSLVKLWWNTVTCFLWFRSCFCDAQSKPKVIIIGGGFAGVAAALKLQHHCDVLLFDVKEHFEFTPSVPRVLVEPNHVFNVRIPYTHILRQAKVLVEEVVELSPTYVRTSKNTYPFDFAVIATGARYDDKWLEDPSVFLPYFSKPRKERLCQQKLELAQEVLVVGGGTVGVEIVGEIVDNWRDKKITLITSSDRLLPRCPTKATKAAEEFMRRNEVVIVFNERVLNKCGSLYKTDQGTEIRADAAFICTGIRPNTQFLHPHFQQNINERGFVHVNKHLQMEMQPHIFVAGDIALIDEEKLAQSAALEGDVVASNILRLIKDKPLRSYEPGPLPIAVSLGKFDGIFIYNQLSFSGFIPALLKDAVEWLELVHMY